MASIEDKVQNLIEKEIEKIGYKLYDVQYAKEGKDYFLRVFIDNDKGIDLEDCEKVSNLINPMLDKDDFIKEQYFLEVSSPGVERVLRKDNHLKDNINKEVEINLFKAYENGKKQIDGILNDFNNDFVFLKIDENIVEIERKNISLIKIKYNW